MKKLLIALIFCLVSLPLFAGEVARAIITTNIIDREPVDELTTLTNDNEKVYFFTDLRGLEGQTVTHRWVLGDAVMAEVTFNVGGPRWRVWSSKNLQSGWIGTWKISVIDAEGKVLSESELNYIDASNN